MKMLHGGRAWRVYLMAAVLGIWLGGGTAVLGAGYQMKIAYSGYTGRSETLTNFPVLVVLSNNVGGASGFNFNGFVTTNGYDLRFVSSLADAGSLNYEIESWNTNAGQASYVWVQVPRIPGDGTGAIWAKWGDTAASNQLACTTNRTTWDESFKGVWHMNGGATDATTNSRNGTVSDLSSTSQGLAAGAQSFASAGNAYMSVLSAGLSSSGTISMMINQSTNVISSSQYLFANPQSLQRCYLSLTPTNTLRLQIKDNNVNEPTQQAVVTGQWYQAAITWNSSTGMLYRNGTLIGSAPVNSAISYEASVYIGAYFSGRTDGFRGLIDEVHLANGMRSSNWMWAAYQTMASNTSFGTYGALQPAGGAPQNMKIAFAGYTNRTETLTNFPVLVVLSNNVGGSRFNYANFVTTNGNDLRFGVTLSDTNSLNYEIELWDPAGVSYVWVQVPTIPSNGTGSIWAKWGDTAASNQLTCTTNGATWTNTYRGVWHMGQTGARDSTTLVSPGTAVNNVTVAGLVGNAQSFNGTSAYIDSVGTVSSYDFVQKTGVFTVSCLAKLASTPADSAFALLGNTPAASAENGFFLAWENRLAISTNGLRCDIVKGQSGTPVISSKSTTNAVTDTNWHHLTVAGNGANVTFWVDGQPWGGSGTMVAKSSSTSTRALNFGRANYTSSVLLFNGLLDETRIENVFRSSDWVWACYQTMASNTAFSAYGAVAESVGALPQILNGVATNVLGASADISGTLVTNGGSSAWVSLFCATNDCTTNESAWIAAGAVTTNFGPFTSGAAFTNTLAGLSSNTWYYWNHMASNASDKAWAATTSSPSFKTFGPPVVNNSTGATSIGIWSAVLNGVLTNGAPAHVFVHLWADGSGTTNIYELGSRSLGGFSTNVGGLLPAMAYSYQCFGSNAYGTAWAAAASNFTTMAALTNGNVTWSGAAGGGNRNWNTASNWVGNLAPTNPTTATIYFKTNGQAVVGLLEADRQIGGVSFDSGVDFSSVTHTVDLGTRTLTLIGNLTGADFRHWSFRLTNGTLRLGTAGTTANLTVGSRADATLTLSPGTSLDPVNVGSVSMGGYDTSGQGNAVLDLRGCQVVGGVLRMRSLSMVGYYRDSLIYLDGNTGIGSIEVSNTVSLGASYGPGNTYVGNPSGSGNLPANISLKIGSSPAQRGNLIVNQVGGNIGTRTDKIVATSGGTFTAYLTNLWVAANGANAGDIAPQYGLVDISRMNSCSVDALDVRLGVPASPQSTDNIKGEWRVCSGTVTAGTVVVGASTGKGYGLLALSNTLFTVTNSLTINATGTNLVSVGAEPSGFDVQGSLVDGGGRILVSFVATPAVGTNWAIRIKGDAQSTLNAMIGASPSRLTSTGTYPNKKAGVLYDAVAGYTYYALADSNAFSTLPVAIAHDERTYEIAPAGTVVIGTNDINNGSSDPDSRPLTLTIYTNGGPESASLTFDAAGDYGVTLKVAANSDYATDTCTVHVVAVNPGVTNALTWKGGAPSALMDRREWMWSANWVEGVPPTNPTIGTINYKTDGQSVTGLLEQSRTVGGLNFDSLSVAASITHALNLGGHTLTVAGSVDSESSRNWTMRMTNGTLRLGSVSQTASLRVGRLGAATLALAPGMVLDPVNVATLSLGEHSSSGSGLCVLDLRGCALLGGVLRLRDLTLTSYSSDGYLYLDSGTGLGSIEVTNTLSIGMSIGSGNTYIGNPADGKLPANVSIKVGTDAARRGNLHLTRVSTYAAARTDKLVATSGGTFTAYLTNLWISANHGVNSSPALYGLLDVARMDSCALDIQSLLLAPDRATGSLATDKYQGELRLGPGTVTLGTGVVGANTNAGFGLLAMSNTTFTVTDTLVINRSGRVEISVDSQPCGVVISNAAGSALSLATATNGAIRIAFRAPYTVRPHYGLAWVGDHEQALKDLQADGRLVVDSTGLAPKMAEVFLCNDVTYVGIQRPIGSVYRFR
jgi:hypothetical protein